MASEKFIIPYPPNPAGKRQWCSQYGLNAFWAGMHWSKRKAAADYWHRLTKHNMDGQNVRREPFKKPVIITMYFNDNMDSINHSAVFKMIEDAMKGRVIEDDSRRFVRGSEIYFHEGNYIQVVVKEI